MIVKEKKTIRNILYYLQGNYRYYFYYGGELSRKYAFIAWLRKRMIRSHIKDQIVHRIKWMNQICYAQGSCIMCGCETTALQMCNRSCNKPCYPPMMNRKLWKRFINRQPVAEDKTGMRVWSLSIYTGKPDLFIWDKNTESYNTVEICSQ